MWPWPNNGVASCFVNPRANKMLNTRDWGLISRTRLCHEFDTISQARPCYDLSPISRTRLYDVSPISRTRLCREFDTISHARPFYDLSPIFRTRLYDVSPISRTRPCHELHTILHVRPCYDLGPISRTRVCRELDKRTTLLQLFLQLRSHFTHATFLWLASHFDSMARLCRDLNTISHAREFVTNWIPFYARDLVMTWFHFTRATLIRLSPWAQLFEGWITLFTG